MPAFLLEHLRTFWQPSRDRLKTFLTDVLGGKANQIREQFESMCPGKDWWCKKWVNELNPYLQDLERDVKMANETSDKALEFYGLDPRCHSSSKHDHLQGYLMNLMRPHVLMA